MTSTNTLRSGPAPQSNQRLDALQGLRALAAGLVVVDHAFGTLEEKAFITLAKMPSIFLGELGVKLFFCISGFIICKSARNLSSGSKGALDFIERRLIRIVPLYWLATSIYILKLSMQGDFPTFDEIVKSFFFVPYENAAGLVRPILGLGWTLDYEMLFYGIFSISLFFHTRFRYSLIIAVLALLVFSRRWGILVPESVAFINVLYLWADSIVLYFLIGLLIGILRDQLSRRGITPSLSFSRASAWSSGILLSFVAATWLTEDSLGLFETLVPIICLLCLCLCAAEQGDTGEARSFVKRTVCLAGDASYSTYVTHTFLLGPAGRLIALTNIPVSPLLFAGIMLLICTMFGVLVFRHVERPLMKIARGWLHRLKPSPAVA
jgi:peptidoglycan/LPS O-acetylase OafA/YrhL